MLNVDNRVAGNMRSFFHNYTIPMSMVSDKQRVIDVLFVFNINHSSMFSRYLQRKLSKVKTVLATSGGHRLTLTGGFDFKHAVSY